MKHFDEEIRRLHKTGVVLGKGSKLHDWFHTVIDLHRWLDIEGEGRATGRAITGVCNLAFFWLAVNGVYLWSPRTWIGED